MPNSHAHHRPKPRRIPAASAPESSLEPEFTAVPRSLPDGVALPEDETGMSIDPEDLGSHFLSEVAVHDDLTARDVAELELLLQNDSLLAAPTVDVPLLLEELRKPDLSGVHARPRQHASTSAADSGKRSGRKLHHAARAGLRSAAGRLRGLAHKLTRTRGH